MQQDNTKSRLDPVVWCLGIVIPLLCLYFGFSLHIRLLAIPCFISGTAAICILLKPRTSSVCPHRIMTATACILVLIAVVGFAIILDYGIGKACNKAENDEKTTNKTTISKTRDTVFELGKLSTGLDLLMGHAIYISDMVNGANVSRSITTSVGRLISLITNAQPPSGLEHALAQCRNRESMCIARYRYAMGPSHLTQSIHDLAGSISSNMQKEETRKGVVTSRIIRARADLFWIRKAIPGIEKLQKQIFNR